MMYKMTRSIHDVLNQKNGLKVFMDETDSSSNAWLQFSGKDGVSYKIRFISRDDDNDVAVRVYGLINVDEPRRIKMLPLLNDLNCKYRYVKFVLDSDGDVNLEYDYPIHSPNPAASAGEIAIRFAKIIDGVYPELIRALRG